MSDDSAVEVSPKPPVADWLDPVAGDDGPYGPDLEYDPDMLELELLAAGKPETQFSAAEPPDWPAVRDKAAALMTRTRDLRVAMHWCRANVNVDGFPGVPPALCLLHGLLDRFWDGLHPMPDADDGDTFARVSALGGLDRLDGLLGDVRQSRLSDDRRLLGLRVRAIEIATDRLQPRPDEEGMSRGQIEAALQEYPDIAHSARAQCAEARHWLTRLASVMNDRFGVGEGVDLKQLRSMLAVVEQVLPAVVEEEPGEAETSNLGAEEEASVEPAAAAPAGARRPAAAGVFSVDSRAEAVRALELVCTYLERNEPTNPAQLLLRRAIRMIDKNFLQLLRELAPDAVNEVARIMGVHPDEIDQDQGSY